MESKLKFCTKIKLFMSSYDKMNFFIIGLSIASSEARLLRDMASGLGVIFPLIEGPPAHIPNGSVIGSN